MTYTTTPESPRWRPWQERFFSRLAFDGSSCWLWSGGMTGSGLLRYGVIKTERPHPDDAATAAPLPWGQRLRAHRFAYTAFRGLPSGECLMHSCDRPACVNPWHLTDGTRAENLADMRAKGRQATGASLSASSARICGEAAAASKLTEADVRKIRAMHDGGMSYRAVAVALGLGVSIVRECAARRTWRHVA